MKKYARWFMILLTVMAMVAVFTVCASAAEPVQEGGHWVINADKIDEILADKSLSKEEKKARVSAIEAEISKI